MLLWIAYLCRPTRKGTHCQCHTVHNSGTRSTGCCGDFRALSSKKVPIMTGSALLHSRCTGGNGTTNETYEYIHIYWQVTVLFATISGTASEWIVPALSSSMVPERPLHHRSWQLPTSFLTQKSRLALTSRYILILESLYTPFYDCCRIKLPNKSWI